MALSLAPSFHDFLFSPLEDDMLNWVLSMLAGTSIGFFVVYSILGVVDSSGTRNKANLFGLISGIVLVSGFALLRFSGAESTGEYLHTVALIVVEAGAVLLTEGAAIVFRQRYVRWFAKSEAYLMGQARLSAAQKQLSDIKQKISQGHDNIQDHENYVEDRMRRYLGVGALEDAAAASTRDEYLSGLADNRGKLFGTQE